MRTGYLPLKSRGWVRLRSADPRDPPRIFLNMFCASRSDMAGMVRSLRSSAATIYAQSPLDEMIRARTCPERRCKTDAELREHLRRHADPPRASRRLVPHGQRTTRRWSTPSCACAGSTACGSRTPR